MRLLHSVQMKNFLSYGPNANRLELENLNIIIGANGSGKSNFFEALSLLKSTPHELVRPIRLGGSVRDWLWKGEHYKNEPYASIEAIVDTSTKKYFKQPLRYRFDFTETANRFDIIDERLEYKDPLKGEKRPYFFYKYEQGNPVLNVYNESGDRNPRKLCREDIDPEKSILAQRYDPQTYPEISYLADVFKDMKIYREWTFGTLNPMRLPQRLDARSGALAEDMSNAALVFSRIKKNTEAKKTFLKYFQATYSGIDDIDLDLNGNTVDIYLREGNMTIPATRLSDGTLRFMALLLILCDPEPPRLICIDEPELGLHPDIINTLHDALCHAASRTQVIISTHSADLVSTFSDNPEYVVVCEKDENGTTLQRLESEKLTHWLEDYRLGAIWMSGEIGGTRW